MPKTAKKSDWAKAIVDTFQKDDNNALTNLLRSSSIVTADAETLAYTYLDKWKHGIAAPSYLYSLYPPTALSTLIRSKKLHRNCLSAIAKECFTIDRDRMLITHQPLFLDVVCQKTCPKDLIDLTIDNCGVVDTHEAILENRSLTKIQYDKIFELYKEYVSKYKDFDRSHSKVICKLIKHKYASIDIVEQFATIVKYDVSRLDNLQLLVEVLKNSRTPESFLLQYLGSGPRDWSRTLLVFCNPACTELVYRKIQAQVDGYLDSFIFHVGYHWQELKVFRKHPRTRIIFQPLLFSSDANARKIAKRIIDCEA